MSKELLELSVELIKAYRQQAQEQALTAAKWRVKVEALEGKLLRMAEKDVDSKLAVSGLMELMK